MILEEFIKEFLENELEESVVTVGSSKKAALGLSSARDIDNYRRQSDFQIEVAYPGKLDAAKKIDEVDNALTKLADQAGISQSRISNIFCQKVETPPLWKYYTNLQVVHRRGWEW